MYSWCCSINVPAFITAMKISGFKGWDWDTEKKPESWDLTKLHGALSTDKNYKISMQFLYSFPITMP